MIVVSLRNDTAAMNNTMYGGYTLNIGREKRNDTAKIISGQITKDCKSFSFIFKTFFFLNFSRRRDHRSFHSANELHHDFYDDFFEPTCCDHNDHKRTTHVDLLKPNSSPNDHDTEEYSRSPFKHQPALYKPTKHNTAVFQQRLYINCTANEPDVPKLAFDTEDESSWNFYATACWPIFDNNKRPSCYFRTNDTETDLTNQVKEKISKEKLFLNLACQVRHLLHQGRQQGKQLNSRPHLRGKMIKFKENHL